MKWNKSFWIVGIFTGAFAFYAFSQSGHEATAPEAASAPSHEGSQNAEVTEEMTADLALTRLMDGNKRYLDVPLRARLHGSRRVEIARRQKPFALILGCADSRVPPEIIFDQGLGDLFVIRVAGNVVDDAVLGSMEYAVDHLDVKLIMVLGHERCGAVDAALGGGPAPGHVATLVEAIKPAVNMAAKMEGDPLENCVKLHAVLMGRKIREAAPILQRRISSGKVKVVDAYYDLDTGAVSLISEL